MLLAAGGVEHTWAKVTRHVLLCAPLRIQKRLLDPSLQ
jgi:hypothetical protein